MKIEKKGVVASLAMVLALADNGMAVVVDHTHPHPGPVASDMPNRVMPEDILDKLDVGVLVEIEGYAAEYGDVNESDITLATVELTVDANLVTNVSAHLGLLWEEDDTEENILDEGFITFGASETIPFYVTTGKLYLPFGNFESAFISDPLTLELAEINQSTALAGFGNSWVDLNAGAFNGDFEEGAADNTVDDLFASIAFMPADDIAFGAYWISDILEADGFENFVNSAITAGYAYEAAGGAGVFLNAQFGPLAMNAEYVMAVEELNLPGGGLRPMAYNAEVSMRVHEKTAVGVKVEGSDDFYSEFDTAPSDKWADWQAGFVVSYDVNDHVTLSVEYLHAEGLDNDESGDIATGQIALVL